MMVNIVSGWWLSPTPLKNMSLSVGMMKFPIDGKIKNVPNHQPVYLKSTSTPHDEQEVSTPRVMKVIIQ